MQAEQFAVGHGESSFWILLWGDKKWRVLLEYPSRASFSDTAAMLHQ
jgi:hypothetical protein